MSSAGTAQFVMGGGIGQPATHLFLITPSNTADLRYVTRAIRAGGAGDLRVMTTGGEDVTIPSVLAGETIAAEVSRVYATGTTATLLMGLA